MLSIATSPVILNKTLERPVIVVKIFAYVLPAAITSDVLLICAITEANPSIDTLVSDVPSISLVNSNNP